MFTNQVSNRTNHSSTAINGLFVLALFYTLYVTSDLILPVFLAMLFSLLFAPVVRTLERAYLPRSIATVIVIVGLCGALFWGMSVLVEPAEEWARKMPEIIREIEFKLHSITHAIEKVERSTSGKSVVVDDQGLPGLLFTLTWSFLAGFALTLFLLFFFLESGDMFLRKMVRVFPSWRQKRQVIVIARLVQTDVSKYLFTITVINTVLGMLVAAAMYLAGMPNPLLWGAMAGILNFLPYLGPAITLTIISTVSILSFNTLTQALPAPLLFLVLTSLEGQLVTPHILGRRLSLNPVVIFIGIIFWAWLWGFIGALVAVPILMTAKIICDHVERLSVISEFMGR